MNNPSKYVDPSGLQVADSADRYDAINEIKKDLVWTQQDITWKCALDASRTEKLPNSPIANRISPNEIGVGGYFTDSSPSGSNSPGVRTWATFKWRTQAQYHKFKSIGPNGWVNMEDVPIQYPNGAVIETNSGWVLDRGVARLAGRKPIYH